MIRRAALATALAIGMLVAGVVTPAQAADTSEWQETRDWACNIEHRNNIYRLTFRSSYMDNGLVRTGGGFRYKIHGGSPESSKSNVNIALYDIGGRVYRVNSGDNVEYDRERIEHRGLPVSTLTMGWRLEVGPGVRGRTDEEDSRAVL